MPMRPYFIVFAIFACVAGLSAQATYLTHIAQPEQQVAVDQIDFIALQHQADAALENLRRGQLSGQLPETLDGRRYSLLVSSK